MSQADERRGFKGLNVVDNKVFYIPVRQMAY
jgi:hypothetical protein